MARQVLLLFTFFLSVSIGCAEASEIPKCDDKRVLIWLESAFLDRWKFIPKNKVELKWERLVEKTFQPNERKCQIVLRSRLSRIALKETEAIRHRWYEEFYDGRLDGPTTDYSVPPWILEDLDVETSVTFDFFLRYDLIKKSWFGVFNSQSFDNVALRKYEQILKGGVEQAAELRRKEVAEGNERWAREKAKEQDRNLKIANADELSQPTGEFLNCVHKRLSIYLHRTFPRNDDQETFKLRMMFIDGNLVKYRYSNPSKKGPVLWAPHEVTINCSKVEKFIGSVEFDIVLNPNYRWRAA
jgi:hypothetical protein